MDLLPTIALTQLPFRSAALSWLDTRKSYISARTTKDYKQYIETMNAHFGELRPQEITADTIRMYQRMRMTRAGASRINQEVGLVQQLLKRTGHWAPIAADYQALPVRNESPGRALSDIERQRLFEAASSKLHWEMAYLFAVISVNTTAGPKEIWTLRVQDYNRAARTIRVQPEGAKNVHRIRVIPLNHVAFAAMERVAQLAHNRGSVELHHFLFPFRVAGNAWWGKYDPERHCTTCKSAWRKLTKAAGLSGLRPYDMRHTGITDILQLPDVSEETAKSIAGHISPRILRTYSHIRLDAKRHALDALVRKSVQNISNRSKPMKERA
jgi:integrase